MKHNVYQLLKYNLQTNISKNTIQGCLSQSMSGCIFITTPLNTNSDMFSNFNFDKQGNLTKCDSDANPLWIDVYEPSQDERKAVDKQNNISLPLHHEMHQIEFSNRFYYENDALYLSVNVVTKAFPFPEIHVITFVITKNRLITLRYSEPNPIKNFIDKLEQRQHHIKNHVDIFLLLLQAILGSVADTFEIIGEQTDTIAFKLLHTLDGRSKTDHSKNLNNTLKNINVLENLANKGYQCLTSMTLAMGYFQNTFRDNLEDAQRTLKSLNQDVQALLKHGEYLNNKLQFLLQSTLGQINIEQTQIIKIFTVLAMVFLPPTLIASIEGMNIHYMPELKIPFAYPVVIVLMLLSGWLPYRYFKKKKWI